MSQTFLLVGLVFSAVLGAIFSVITAKNKRKIEKTENKSRSTREKRGNGQTKSLRKRIKIAAINGMMGAILLSLVNIINVIMGVILVPLVNWLFGLFIGLIIFAMNVVSAMTWEKNENVKTKSKLKIFLSPVIKGVIIGPIIYIIGTAGLGIGGVNGMIDVVVYSMVDTTVYMAVYGVIIGLMQLSIRSISPLKASTR